MTLHNPKKSIFHKSFPGNNNQDFQSYIDILYFSTGVPLLEENELLETTEGSNSSVSGGDTGSATYSETSSKT